MRVLLRGLDVWVEVEEAGLRVSDTFGRRSHLEGVFQLHSGHVWREHSWIFSRETAEA